MTLDAFRDYLDRIDAALGAAGLDPGPGRLRDGRVRPQGDRGHPRRARPPRPIRGNWPREVLAMRRRLEASRPRQHLEARVRRRSPISSSSSSTCSSSHAASRPELLRPNLWDALDALRRHDLIDQRVAYRPARRLRLPPRRRGPAAAHPESQRRRTARGARRAGAAGAGGSTTTRPTQPDPWRRSSPTSNTSPVRTRAIFDRIITSRARAARPAASPG